MRRLTAIICTLALAVPGVAMAQSSVELIVPVIVGGALMLMGLGLHRRANHRPV